MLPLEHEALYLTKGVNNPVYAYVPARQNRWNPWSKWKLEAICYPGEPAPYGPSITREHECVLVASDLTKKECWGMLLLLDVCFPRGFDYHYNKYRDGRF